MRIPVIRGVIDRRILANFRVDPDVLGRLLPAPFRPQLVGDWGVAGVCMIRLKQIRPQGLPAAIGLKSENAAHRIAVEWDSGGERRTGVYIPRRDTNSWFNVVAGGRLFPGSHHLATFETREDDRRLQVAMASRDGAVRVVVEGEVADTLPSDSVFSSLEAASSFFEAGSLGFSPRPTSAVLDGLELATDAWNVEPLAVDRIESSYFGDAGLFPAGSVAFDHALLMHGAAHSWRSCDSP